MFMKVQSPMFEGTQDAIVELDHDVLTVKLINNDVWIKYILEDVVADAFNFVFEEGDTLGLAEWYVADANIPIKQGRTIETKLDILKSAEWLGIDPNLLPAVKTESNYEGI